MMTVRLFLCLSCVSFLSAGRASEDVPLIRGEGTNEWVWTGRPFEVESGGLYGLSFDVVREMSGTLMSGVTGYNVDWQWPERGAGTNRFVVVMPKGTSPMKRPFRFGHYYGKGEARVGNPSLVALRAEHAECNGVVLGAGEYVRDDTYQFASAYTSFGRVAARTLESYEGQVVFNTSRWHFGGTGSVTYRHELAGLTWKDASVEVRSCYRTAGEVRVLASADGGPWTALLTVTNVSSFKADVPRTLFPAKTLRIRFASEGRTALQVDGYVLTGRTSRPLPETVGATRYVETATGRTFGESRPSIIFDDTYGELVGGTASADLWRASSGWKVGRWRKPPKARAKGLVVRTAANEAESVQLVVSPKADLEDVRIGVEGAWTDAVTVRRVAYVPVALPTDEEGARCPWPDPLPPQDAAPFPVRAGENQPFWITVRPPKGTVKGRTVATLRVEMKRSGRTETVRIPLGIEVFGFELPDETTCRTALGLSPRAIFEYQPPKDEEDRRRIFERYLKAFAEYRLSPYDPVPFDPPKCRWTSGPSKAEPEKFEPVMDWTDFDREMSRVIAKYHFNSFNLHLQGIGSGDGKRMREKPRICGFDGDEPGYQVLMGKYLGGFERHLAEKDWLDRAYVYWFDEPTVEIYPEVMKVFGTLKRHAPRLRRLLTEQPEKELAGGPNLWCPMLLNFHSPDEPARRAAGDDFWWYVCTMPKAPFATLFIDHAGIELRTWLWQTWGEKVSGILVWATTVWNCHSRYLGGRQDPWTDAMSWDESGNAWGNGDGRFFYPPKSGEDPVPTMRVAMLRDGLEDYEYFAILRGLDPTNPLLSVPKDVYGALDSFSRTPDAIEAHRLRLAREIERLTAAKVRSPEEVFANPPREAQAGVWWHWMGGQVTEEGILKDLDWFRRTGIFSATVFGMADSCTPWAKRIGGIPTGGLHPFDERWWTLFAFACREGKRRGIDIGLHNCPGYTSTGGPWIPSRLAMRELVFGVTNAMAQISTKPNARYPVFNEDSGKFELPPCAARQTDVVEIGVARGGIRVAHIPMGAFVQPADWGSVGLECDKMNPEAVDLHLDHVFGELKRHLGDDLPAAGLRHVLLDSYEAGDPNWTPRMREEFTARRGYDPLEFLPILGGYTNLYTAAEVVRFRADFDRTVKDLYRDVLFKRMSARIHAEGLEFSNEPYLGPFDSSEVAPFIDRIMTEFWYNPKGAQLYRPFHREFNTYSAPGGRRHNVVEAEAFTGRPGDCEWTEMPANLKPGADDAFLNGVNRLILHTNPLQPWGDDVKPGVTMGRWGTHFGRNQTWAECGKPFFDYLARCQALLQWGEPSGKRLKLPFKCDQLARTDGRRTIHFLVARESGAWSAGDVPSGKWYDPVTGKIGRFGCTIGKGESGFYEADGGFASASRERNGQLPPLSVAFQPKPGDRSQSDDPDIRYFSGTMTYRATFDLPASVRRIELCIPDPADQVFTVRVNGQAAGTAWCAPWRIELPVAALKERGNALEIDVVNSWRNRLIGDEREPSDCEFAKAPEPGGSYLVRYPDWFGKGIAARPSKGRRCFTTWNYFTKDSPLRPSGLISPPVLRCWQ